MTALRIADAAAVTGIPATTLRFWERTGLLTSSRTPNGYRVFDDCAVDRLRFISAAKRLDLPLGDVRELLRSWDGDTCRAVKKRMRPMVTDRPVQTQACIEELTQLAEALWAGLGRLDALPDRDSSCGPDCGFLTAGPPEPARNPTPDAAAAVLACSLTGVAPAAQLDRWRTLLTAATVTRAGRTARVELGIDHAGETAAVICDEQRCCPFLAFRLDFTSPTVVLTITAPTLDAVPFIDALLDMHDTVRRRAARPAQAQAGDRCPHPGSVPGSRGWPRSAAAGSSGSPCASHGPGGSQPAACSL